MVLSLFRFSLVATTVLFMAASYVPAGFGQVQGDQPKPIAPKASPSPTPLRIDLKNLTAEQVAELAIVYYGLPSGREKLNQIRKTTFERGRSTFVAADGTSTSAKYQRFIIRGDTLDKEKIRLDQEFPSARYALVQSD